jgi:hypothetical protein
MQYKTVVGAIPDVDEEINELSQHGWVVHTFQCIGMLSIDEESDTPMLAYLMVKEVPDPVEVERPPRRVIGRHA